MPRHIYPGTFTGSVLIIGNEILSGRTQDTNTPWIAERLTAQGIVLEEVRIIPDDRDMIIFSVNELRKEYGYVFITGGIGPTHDDITAEAVAAAFGLPLVRDEDACRVMIAHYGSAEELTPPRLKMCMIPAGAALIPNPVSAAPGFIIENVHVMAGVPRIMQAMMQHVLGLLPRGSSVLTATISCELRESTIAAGLTALQEKYPALQIGSYPYSRGGVPGLNLVLRGTDRAELETAADGVMTLVREMGGKPHMLP